jgi:hypothetical protein
VKSEPRERLRCCWHEVVSSNTEFSLRIEYVGPEWDADARRREEGGREKEWKLSLCC